VRAQSRKVGEGARKFGLDFRMQDRPKPFLFKFPGPHLLVAEQAHFGDEADVRDGDGIADQELAVRR
jgi:hypothetical protein